MGKVIVFIAFYKLLEYIHKLLYVNACQCLYRRVYSQSQLFRIYSLTTQRRFDDSVTEHRGIVENLIAGNWKEADRINRIHLSLAREEIIEHFEAKKEEDKENEEE